MGKGSPPPAPDYTAAANAQGQQSIELANAQTAANRPDVSTPWGSISWKNSGTSTQPAWKGNVDLTPAEQGALNDQQSIQQGRSGIAKSLLGNEAQQATGDLSPAPPASQQVTGAGAGIATDPTQINQQATDAVWNQFKRMNLPLQQQQTEGQQSQLEAQGLRPGDAAYDTAAKNLMNTQFNQTQTAQDQAVLAGEQAGSTLFGETNAAQAQKYGQGVNQTQVNNSLIPQDLQNKQANIALDEGKQAFTNNLMNGILTGQQVNQPTFPTAGASGTAQPAQLLQAAGMQGQSSLDAYNAQTGAANGLLGGIGSMATGAAAMMF